MVTGAPSDQVEALFSLKGRVAVVTGASRGIGHAIAEAFARSGALTVGSARSSAPSSPFAAQVSYVSADASTHIASVIEGAVARFGRLDILVNAAGVSLAAPPDRSDDQTRLDLFDRTIALNLRAAYAASLAAGRHMKAGASIINVTSIGALQGFPGNPGYVASKGGLAQLTRALAVDLGTSGIRVNALVPGYIHTDMTAASYADPARHAQRAGRTCLGRWGTVNDLTGAAIFLASDASTYMTGQDLVIDGGWTARGL